MERKILITGIILAICISVIIGVVFIYSGVKTGANPIKMIPQDAAYVLRLNGLGISSTINDNQNKIWQDLNLLETIKKIKSETNIIDSLISTNEKLSETISKNDIYISGHYSGGKNINHLTLFKTPSNFGEKFISNYLNNLNDGILSNYSSRKYEGRTIFSISLKSKRIIYLSTYNGIMMYSSSPVLIEDAIRQSTLNHSLLDNQDFFEMINATGKNKEANLFVDFSQVGKLFSIIGNSDRKIEYRNYQQFGKWSEFDINLKSDLILLNGFSGNKKLENNFLSAITHSQPIRLNIANVLPASTGAFLAFGISSPEESYQAYLNYLKSCGKYARYQANLKNLNDKYKIDFEKFFLSHLDNELALAYKNNSYNSSGSTYIVLKCKSGNNAEKELKEIVRKIKNIKSEASIKKYSPDNSIQFNIYKVPISPLFGRLIGDFYDVFNDNYICIVDNYMVIAGSYKDASQFIYNYILKKTLNNEEVYRDFASNLSIKSYALAYINLTKSNNFFRKYLSKDIIKEWKDNRTIFNNVQATGFQISSVSGMPYYNVLLKRFDNYRGKPQTVWESLLDTTISIKPSFVINHYTNQNEIFIQDDNNKIYLINQSGRIIWKLPLNERINSDIFQIDYYKNNKLQILFSTENYLHLIDRNGNYVDKYPIRLREKSSAGVALIDYDKNKNYRFFIPCKNNKVYAYSKEGDLISGWTFSGSDYNVNHPINHFKVANNDYIVFGDKNKTYILDRRGNERVIVKTPFSKSVNNNYYLHNTGQINTSYILTTDLEGSVIKIYLDGNTEKVKISDFSKQHFFDYKDINADGRNDYIFLDNNQLSAYNNEGDEIFKTTIKSEILQRPVYYNFSHTNRKIGLVSEKDENIYLINSNGEQYKNFPLEGKTLFSIGYFDLTSSRFNLIVGGRNNFLYNYAVE